MKSLRYLFNFCFILSGLSGLVYEVLWTRYLGLFIGNSTFAHAVVLSAFMGGLALGNLLFGGLADRRGDHIRLYGVIEILIGVFAIFTPLIFEISRKLFIEVGSNFTPGSGMSLLLKVAFSVPLVIFPAMLMGGTLPIMVKSFARTETVQKSISILYALNSFGAVIGTLISAFVLIPTFGLETSLYIAATINIFCGGIGFLIYYLQAKFPFTPVAIDTLPPTAHSNDSVRHVEKITPILWAAFFAGLTGMFYEIGWFRFFALTLGSTTYSFALMVAAFISGITIGSMVLGFFPPKSKERQRQMLILCQLGIAIIMTLSIFWYERIPFFFGILKNYFSQTMTQNFLTFELIKYSFCFLVMFIPTLFFGVFLPLATSVVSEAGSDLGKSVGRIFAYNTIGGVIGGAIGGFVMLPMLGLQHTFAVTALLNASMAVMLFWTLPFFGKPSAKLGARRMVTGLALMGIMAGTLFSMQPWAHAVLNSGMFRTPLRQSTFHDFKSAEQKRTILFSEQDPSGMVTVEKDPSNTVMSLRFNGKPDASDHLTDMKTQLLLSQLPLILHPHPQTVLNVGVGSGQTAGGILLYPEVKRLDLAEISRGVVEASKYFSLINHKYWQDPRARIYIEDAKNFLALVNTKYDVIISEPTNVWISGVASLFTKEFFQQASNKLNEDGMLVQWLHLYNMSDESVYLILRTLNYVFPDVSIWQLNGDEGRFHDIMYIASKKPLVVDFDKMQRKFAEPTITAEFAKVGINSLKAMLELQITGPKIAKPLAGVGAINTDIKPILEYSAPIDFFKKTHSQILTNIQIRLTAEERQLYINSYTQNDKN